MDPEVKRKQLHSWRGVVEMIGQALCQFNPPAFRKHIGRFYLPLVSLLGMEVSPELRLILHDILVRVGRELGIAQEGSLVGDAAAAVAVAFAAAPSEHPVPVSGPPAEVEVEEGDIDALPAPDPTSEGEGEP